MSDKETQVEEMEAASEEAQTEAVQNAEATDDTTEKLTAELHQSRDQILRQAAEFQNYRRRMEREYATQVQRGRIEVIEPMLNVLDDFRRSLDAAEQVAEQSEGGAAYDALKTGVDLVYQNFSDVLQKIGVEYIEAVGQPFDENLHEALMQQPAPEGTAPGTVLAEIQRGYCLGDRVLRHSRVVVAA